MARQNHIPNSEAGIRIYRSCSLYVSFRISSKSPNQMAQPLPLPLNQLTIQYIPHQTQLVLTTLYAPILLHKTPYSLPKTCCQDCPSFDPQASSCRVADTHTVQICTSPPIPRHAILFRFPILFYWLTVAGIGAPSPVFCRLHFFILKLVVYKGDIHLCRK